MNSDLTLSKKKAPSEWSSQSKKRRHCFNMGMKRFSRVNQMKSQEVYI